MPGGPPSIPEVYGSDLYVKTDPPSPVDLTVTIRDFELSAGFLAYFTLPGGTPRFKLHKTAIAVEIGGMKPGTRWTVIICNKDVEVRSGIATRAPQKADFSETALILSQGLRPDDMPCGDQGRALVGEIPDLTNSPQALSPMIEIADITYTTPQMAAWHPPYLTVATLWVDFYSHAPPTKPEADALSQSHFQEILPLDVSGLDNLSNYAPYSGPSVRQSEGAWIWDTSPSWPPITPDLTSVDLTQERATGRKAFYSGILFGVATSALIQALSQTLSRRTERE